jgi:hypothetical protein
VKYLGIGKGRSASTKTVDSSLSKRGLISLMHYKETERMGEQQAS